MILTKTKLKRSNSNSKQHHFKYNNNFKKLTENVAFFKMMPIELMKWQENFYLVKTFVLNAKQHRIITRKSAQLTKLQY